MTKKIGAGVAKSSKIRLFRKYASGRLVFQGEAISIGNGKARLCGRVESTKGFAGHRRVH